MSVPSARKGRTRFAVTTAFTVAAIALAGCSATTTGHVGGTSSGPVVIPEKDGPGVSATAINVSWGLGAFPSQDDASLVAQRREANSALVDAFNEKGGIEGRKVQLVEDDPGSDLMAARNSAYNNAGGLAVPDATNGQETCNAYKDKDVFALLFNPLLTAPYGTPAAAKCLGSQGQPAIGGLSWTRADYRAAPAAAGLSLASDRFFDALVAAGKDSGFFASDAKVALITDPTDTSGFVDSAYIPALAQSGISNVKQYPLAPTATPADALSTVVKLKAEGIDHVVYASTNFVAPLSLLPVMQEQDYLPKMLTVDGPDWVLLSVIGTVRVDDKLLDALSTYVSKPARDLAALTDEQKTSPAGALYTEVVEAHPTLQNVVSLDLADSLMLLKAALEKSGSEYINAEAFTTGLRSLTDYQSPRLIETKFGTDQQDGAAGIIRTSFSAECSCVKLADKSVTF